MKVLIACEFSGVVRRSFRERGHKAWSCDLLPAEDGSKYHIKGDVSKILNDGWDLMIAHPPCTHLCVSGAKWFEDKKALQEEAFLFVVRLLAAPIPKIAIENPIGVLSKKLCKPSQIIQPWWFGDAESKATCLWLVGLPLLEPVKFVKPKLIYHSNGKTDSAFHYNTLRLSKEQRSKERSRTFDGIAKAMADQWG